MRTRQQIVLPANSKSQSLPDDFLMEILGPGCSFCNKALLLVLSRCTLWRCNMLLQTQLHVEAGKIGRPSPSCIVPTHRTDRIIAIKSTVSHSHWPVGVHPSPLSSCIVDEGHIADIDVEILHCVCRFGVRVTKALNRDELKSTTLQLIVSVTILKAEQCAAYDRSANCSIHASDQQKTESTHS